MLIFPDLIYKQKVFITPLKTKNKKQNQNSFYPHSFKMECKWFVSNFFFSLHSHECISLYIHLDIKLLCKYYHILSALSVLPDCQLLKDKYHVLHCLCTSPTEPRRRRLTSVQYASRSGCLMFWNNIKMLNKFDSSATPYRFKCQHFLGPFSA